MAKAKSEFQQTAREHVERLDNLIGRGSVPRLRKLYKDAITELESRLAKELRSGSAEFSIHQARVLLAQAKQGLIKLSSNLVGAMDKQNVLAQETSARALIKDIKRLEKVNSGAAIMLPIEQAARFAGIIDKRRTSLMKMSRSSFARYGSSLVQAAEKAISLSLLRGETGHQAVGKVAETLDVEWWRGERIVRTETAWAFNATHADAIKDTAQTFTDMMMRWVELVADVTLSKLDDRVGDDSVAMHGQLAKPGGLFTMPLSAPVTVKISPSLQGQSWEHPPNRPNDRSTLQPWRPGWGWGWELVGGARVERS